ncbi:2117_t:CDS:2 [Funneliformis geosporum]|nr:2117_t:CDS:2 [Funneliformis geosporum]
MEEFFTKLTQFGLQLEESCRELRTTIESPALSSGYHENLRDISIQSKSLLNEVIALEKIPNINHPMLNLVLITKNVYDKIQHEINLLEEQLREFGLEEIFVAKSTIVNEELIEESSNEPLKLNPERNTSPVTKAFKRLSTQTQESPTLESFGLSDHALALLKAGTPEMIKDYGIQLNSNESKKKDMHIQKVTNKIDVTPTPTLEHQQISPIPSFPSDQMPECTQIRPITKEEMTTLGYDIRRQVSMEFLNQVIYDINEMVADKHDLPDFPRQAWNEFTYDELLNEIGVGGTAAIDIVLLALITLDRIVSRCSDPDLLKKRYRIL